MNRRRKEVLISHDAIEQLLLPGIKHFEVFGLPETARLVSLFVHENSMNLCAIFEDDSFPEVPQGACYDRLRIEFAWQRETDATA